MLTRLQLLRALTFIGAVAGVYAAAIWFVINSRKKLPRSSRFQFVRSIVYALAVLGVLCMCYGRWIEPRRLEITHVRLTTASLPQGSTLRIVHLSDFHCEAKPISETKIPAIVSSEHPDLIVYTGDMANNYDGIDLAEGVFRKLPQIAPTYVVKGNWDVLDWSEPDIYTVGGAKLLDGAIETLNVRGNFIQIVGVGYDKAPSSVQKLETATPGLFTIFLTHTPDEILRVAETHRANLYLAGHTHGGQVALPFYGAIITLSKFDKRFESGLHRVADTYLYVSRGIGTDSGFLPKVRFLSPPEIVVIDVTGTAPAKP